MKLTTKKIERPAQKQYPLGNDLENQQVVAKLFCPWNQWTWYLMNQDPEDPDYCWGIVKGFEVEIGSFSLGELARIRGPFGLKIERDLYFSPMTAADVYKRVKAGGHV